jgi:hypothetical protein
MPPETTNNAGGNAGGNDNQQGGQQGQDGGTLTWDQILAQLPQEQRALYDDHLSGLRSALQSERTQHQELAKKLREATQQLEQGSETRQQLEALSGQLEAAQRRAEFFEEATQPEIGCTNIKLAFIAAQEVGAIDQRGRINWTVLREQFPELFKQKTTPPGNAGDGTNTGGQPPGQGARMDDIIRRKAGVNAI